MKKRVALVLALLMALVLTACGGADSAASGAASTGSATGAADAASGGDAATGEALTFGYACKDVNDTFQTYLIEAAQAYADANGITLNVVDAQNDTVKQQDQVRDFITQGVDAILVLIIDTSSAGPITQAAQDAGVPLVYVNTNPYPDGDVPDGIYYVGSIEKEAGEMQAEYVGELLGGEGNVCIIQGQLVHEGAVQRTEGVKEKLAELYPGVEVLAEQPADWQKDKAMTVTENWLTAYNNDVQAIFANNDEMALGAMNALQAAGLTDAKVIGIDGTPAALEAIQAGTLAGSVFQDADGQAQGAMEIAKNVVEGNAPAERVTWVPFVLITPDNVAEFV